MVGNSRQLRIDTAWLHWVTIGFLTNLALADRSLGLVVHESVKKEGTFGRSRFPSCMPFSE